MNSSAAAMRSQRSHHGLRTFTPAHCKSLDLGWRLSFATAAANSQSRADAGFNRRSLRCAPFASPMSLSYSVSRGTSTIGDSGSAPYASGNAEPFGRWLSKKRCSSLSDSPDRVASSSIRRFKNPRAASKSAVRFTFSLLPRILLTSRRNQPLSQLQSIHRPETPRSRSSYVRLPSLRTTTQNLLNPLGGDGIPPVHSAEECACNSGIRICVPAAHDGIHHSFFQAPSMEKLPQRVTKGDQNPSLLLDVVARWCNGRASNRLQQCGLRLHLPRPSLDLAI